MSGTNVSSGDYIDVSDIDLGLFTFVPLSDDNGSPYTTFTFRVQDDSGSNDLDQITRVMTMNVTGTPDCGDGVVES